MPSPPSPTDLETRTVHRGQKLLNAMRAGQQTRHSHNNWLDKLLDKVMEDERFRVQALRFVDVLPALDDDADLVRHMQEYFDEHELPLTGLVTWGMRHARRGVADRLVARAIRRVMQGLARRFMGGADAKESLATARALRDRGLAFSLDVLGEASVSEAEADSYQQLYLDNIAEYSAQVAQWPANDRLDSIGDRALPRLNLSIKISSLYSQCKAVDPEGSINGIAARLRPILLAAKAAGVFVFLDMEQYDLKDIVIGVFRKLLIEDELRQWPDCGLALQAYLTETEADIDSLAAWARQRGAPVTVRLVRGAYWDYETVIARQQGWDCPVWARKWQTDACYERCLARLMQEHPHLIPAVATHNVRSIALAMELADDHGLAAGQYEFQMLFGMAESMEQVIVDAGHRLRVYVPFGELIPGMAYLVRRLLENSSSQSFQRIGMREHLSDIQLLASPGGGLAAQQPVPESERRAERGERRDHEERRRGPVDRRAADRDVVVVSDRAGHRQFQVDDRRLAVFCSEPLHRFTSEQQRQDFDDTLNRVRTGLGGDWPLRIGDERRQTVEDFVSSNPSRPEEIIGRVARAGEQDALDAVAAATGASESWAALPPSERAALLQKAAVLLRSRRDEFAALEIFEAGKTWTEADANVVEAIDFLEYYAIEAIRLGQQRWSNRAGETNAYSYRPRGVGVVIAPWNFPLAIVAGMTAAAIVTGNAVVLKPSSLTPVIAARFVELLIEAGVPPGVINFLPGPGTLLGPVLVGHPDVHFVAFTGSRLAGLQIIEQAARVTGGQRHVRQVIAEMGGKNVIIVDSDADPDAAVRGVIESAFGYQGQKCSAASRVIVVGEHYNEFVDRVVAATRSLPTGLPEDPATAIGPVIDESSLQRIRQSIEAGAAIATQVYPGSGEEDTGTTGPNSTGWFLQPAIFRDVPPDSALAQQEIFGPVLAMIPAADFDQALTIANNTDYALTGGLYSRSPSRLQRAARELEVGNLYLNRRITGAVVGYQPFGGYRLSGVGSKAGGPDYLLQFMQPKTVSENTLRRGFAPTDVIARESRRSDDGLD